MNNALYFFERPANEPVHQYPEGSPERQSLEKELARQKNLQVEIPLVIGGKEIKTGDLGQVVSPHDNKKVIATYHKAGTKEVQMAIDAAMESHKKWADTPWVERASVALKVADLLSTKYRDLINAATMIGQGKTAFQAEIDAACETIDFIRFNAYYAGQIFKDQPFNGHGVINRIEHRPLEGFVFAVTPFNFTAIASNLTMAPVIVGNTSVWKPATTALLSNYYLMKIYQEAGLPDGVINFIPGKGSVIGDVIFSSKDLGGVHFTGSNGTFNQLWKGVADNLPNYKSYPRIVGETGGKDFICVHPTANVEQVSTAIVRGAFEYQGQKCSAASRAYIPQSLWKELKEKLISQVKDVKQGDISDFCNFMGAVIDEKAFDSIASYIDIARQTADTEFITGGNYDKSVGYFIEPTIIHTKDPHFVTMREEIFGPVITIYVYEDDKYEDMLHLCDETSPYALTGSIFSNDLYATQKAFDILRYAAGNFYINDKPTGSVVGQQPFGGSRQSGTNDKAGSYLNLIRWISPRTIKETFNHPVDFRYPHMINKNCESHD